MDIENCFEENCKRGAIFKCECTFPETYFCQKHAYNHTSLKGKHIIASIFREPIWETKKAIIDLLQEETIKIQNLKKKFLDSFNKEISKFETNLKEIIRTLDSEYDKLYAFQQKVIMANKVSEVEQDPILKLLVLTPEEAIKKIKFIIPENNYSSWNIKALCWINDQFDEIMKSFFKKKLETYHEITQTKTETIVEENNNLKIHIETVERKIDEIKDSLSSFENWNKQINEIKDYISSFESWKLQVEEIKDSISSFESWKIEAEEIKYSISSFENWKIEAEEIKDSISSLKSWKIEAEEIKDSISSLKSWKIEAEEIKDSISSLKSWKKKSDEKFENYTQTPNYQQDADLTLKEETICTNQSQPDDLKAELKQNIFKILNEPNNWETERDYKSTVWRYENELVDELNSNKGLNKLYQDYKTFYHQVTSLYLIDWDKEKRTILITYDTENEEDNIELLETPEPLNSGTCVIPIFGSVLFCFGKRFPASGITMIIDAQRKIQMLPSGRACYCSSALYFNRNVYCFGGWINTDQPLTLSERFDLDQNKWYKLKPLPEADANCHCIMFNGNILVSGYRSSKIWKYSIAQNNFEEISFQFERKKRKILINEERLYLIECHGFIYESEVGNEKSWKKIGNSIISDKWPSQVYLSFNKDAIYIGCRYPHAYYKFNLDEKDMIQL